MKKSGFKKSDSTVTVDEQIRPQKAAFNNFPVVGIGASAGGLEALEQFFSNVPPGIGMAFIVIQHLDPNHVGMLPEILQRTTDMKVTQAEDLMKVLPNHVYVIPPNKSMSIVKGHLRLLEPIEIRGLRLPIDFFFNSLADEQLNNAIGVILSGMGSDGSQGIKSIKERHGIVLVQDPATSVFDAMPRSAIDSVVVDIQGTANELPGKLIDFINFNTNNAIKNDFDGANKSNIEKIVHLLRTSTGHDFSQYKKNTLYRRVERRMGVHKIDKIANYVRFLQENPSEINILFKELLIGVTNFFRDSEVWNKLKNSVLPEMLNELPDGYILRAWVPACSTGEEAYSLAIIFDEVYQEIKHKKKLYLQIFATDIDNDAINIARKGNYSSNIATNVSLDRIDKYFKSNEYGYRINTNIREMVVFASHNIINDPPFTKLDILSCRNLFIYIEPDLQKQLMSLFYYSLNVGGLMILGTAESDSSKKGMFDSIDTKLKLLKRSNNEIESIFTDFPSSYLTKLRIPMNEKKANMMPDSIQSLAEQLLLQRYAPASVLISGSGDIIYITGRTGKYLEPAAGKANMNIYIMAREGLSHKLPEAIRKAKQNYEPVLIYDLKVGSEKDYHMVDVIVQQIEKPDLLKNNIIVVFSEVPEYRVPIYTKLKPGQTDALLPLNELEIALARAYEDLKTLREEMETSNEELSSLNEELQSSNEELQSSNEELTSSKEEMQSLNEELQTVNAELQIRVADYLEADNDMKNLLNSTDIATLFLDRELNIRRFTDQLTKLIKLRPTDIGRPFTDMVSELQYPEIAEHSKEVLRTLVFKEMDIATNDNKWYTVRIMPYRNFDDRIDGLVITFIDITFAKHLEAELNKTKDLLRKNNLM
ncbi:MAG: PAS domain-containing protein [Candidatus Kapabacteria bacterium]|nr:PAS domain-containing protein [Candidatus Kapabacteria bacterium]